MKFEWMSGGMNGWMTGCLGEYECNSYRKHTVRLNEPFLPTNPPSSQPLRSQDSRWKVSQWSTCFSELRCYSPTASAVWMMNQIHNTGSWSVKITDIKINKQSSTPMTNLHWLNQIQHVTVVSKGLTLGMKSVVTSLITVSSTVLKLKKLANFSIHPLIPDTATNI